MTKSSRVTRTTPELLRALDDHLYLLRQSLYGLPEDPAYIKILASELRTLVCKSSGTEGLLWRLADELGVSDTLELVTAESANRDHPLMKGMAIRTLPCHRPNQGRVNRRAEHIPLRYLIKKCEAIYVVQVSDRIFTHELLIGAIAGQMGSAHEAEGLDYSLARLKDLLVNDRQLFVQVLAFDAELALQIGDRVLDHAEKHHGYRRAPRPTDYGDTTLLIRFSRRQLIVARIPLFSFRSPIAEATIACAAGPSSSIFTFEKRGVVLTELEAPYPKDWQDDVDAIFALSYSSAHREARVITNDQAGEPVECNFGWLDAREITEPEPHAGFEHFINVNCIPIYARLLSPRECGELLQVSADMRELRHDGPPEGPFPS